MIIYSLFRNSSHYLTKNRAQSAKGLSRIWRSNEIDSCEKKTKSELDPKTVDDLR